MKIKSKVKKYGKGGSIKDDIININGDYYNNDIIDGLDRDARVLNNQENKFLNRYGVTDRNSFYNKFPTEEIFNFKNGSDKARHYGLSTPYVDETTITLKNGGSINKYPNGGRSAIIGTPRQEQAYRDSLFIHNDGERMRNLLINPSTNENTYANEVNRYYTGTLLNTNNPTNQALSRLNRLNNEFPAVEARQNRTFPSGYTAYASLFKKPVQPIILDRPKENITTLNQEQQYLPHKEQHLEFDPIGLKKGTYFTRPRQQQEAGQGKMDYFDSKTGKFLKTMGNGGSSIDSLRHQAGKTMDYEFYRGSANGTGLSNYGNPKLNNPTKGDAVDWYMENIAPQLGMFQSAMEKGEAGDFLYNSGKDVRPYAIQEHLKQIDPNNSQNWQDAGGKYKDRKDSTKWDGYWGDIQKLPENQRRQLINKGRDFYYKNINNPSPGVPNDAYDKTWYGRIWNTNDYKEFDPNNPKFIPKKQNGGNITRESDKPIKYGYGGSVSYKDFKKKYKDL